MAIEAILTNSDPGLREPSQPIVQGDPQIAAQSQVLHTALAEFRERYGFGRAISAPQLGINKRLIAVNLGATPFELRNPVITWRSEEMQEVWDDCLSLPDVVVRVSRHQSISLQFEDAQGRVRHWQTLAPDLAELIQHEIDHLDGVLMLDRANGDSPVRPIEERESLIGAARPSHRLSLSNIQRAMTAIDPVFLHSPQYECEPLSEALGCPILLKLDYLNPIRSFKGRGASFLLNETKDTLGQRPLVCATAGNWGQALAYACRSSARKIDVFAPENANPLKVKRMRELGASIHLEGHDFDASKAAARAFAEAKGGQFVEDGREAPVSEGHGTIGVELLSDNPLLDAVVVPLGNGALLAGIGRWVKAASPMTRVVGVCARGAPAMRDSFIQGCVVSAQRADTIADGIAVREPVPEAVADLQGIVDEVVLVDDQHIVDAMRALSEHAGQLVEPAGAVAIAGVIAHASRFVAKRIACVVCGSNLTAAQIREFQLV